MDIKKISLNNISYDIRDSRVTTNVVNGNAVWTSADSITVTNAANGNVIKESGISITTSLGSDNTTVPTSLAVKNAIDALPPPTDISVIALTTDISSSCSITGAANSGKNQVIIYTNATGSDKVVTVPTTYTTPKGEALELTCSDGGYVEINYLNVSGTIYARGL